MSDSAPQATSAHIVADVIDDGQVSRQQLLVVGLCMFFNMLDGFDITAMAVVAGAVSEELQLTPDRLGLIFSFALAGMMGGAMFLAPVSDLIGRRGLIILSVALVGVSILLTARATGLGEFLALRFVSGLGAGAMLASQAALTAEYSPEKYRSLSVAATTSGYPLGAMMTSVVAAWIMPAFGWRGMFWFGGAVTVAMVVVAWAFIPESLKYLLERQPGDALQRANRILAKLEKETLRELPRVSRMATWSRQGLRTRLGVLVRQYGWKTLALWTAFFLSFTTLYFLLSWIPRLMEETGYSPETGRTAFFLFNLGGVVGIFVLGTLSTRWNLTRLVSGFLFLSAICMVVFATAPGQLGLLMVVILAMGLLQQGGFTGLYAVAAKVYPTEFRSTGIGWAIGLGRLGAVVGPALAGWLIAAGMSMSGGYYVFAVPVAVAAVMAYRLDVR